MGKALQIRVSAVTWDQGLPEKLWPRITELAATVPSSEKKLGVVEIVYRLYDGLQFMKWPQERQNTLGDGIKKAHTAVKDLEKALADWDARKANTLSDTIEDILESLERNYC